MSAPQPSSMKTILDYKLVSAASAGEVENFVRTYLQDGVNSTGHQAAPRSFFVRP